ncbi:MAG TPA: hypothetical protein VGO56_16385 [Pyrinomonadaceae bacterium]|nr:hypothetical protein [Pyrinomonadaceae bacterium]
MSTRRWRDVIGYLIDKFVFSTDSKTKPRYYHPLNSAKNNSGAPITSMGAPAENPAVEKV